MVFYALHMGGHRNPGIEPSSPSANEVGRGVFIAIFYAWWVRRRGCNWTHDTRSTPPRTRWSDWKKKVELERMEGKQAPQCFIFTTSTIITSRASPAKLCPSSSYHHHHHHHYHHHHHHHQQQQAVSPFICLH